MCISISVSLPSVLSASTQAFGDVAVVQALEALDQGNAPRALELLQAVQSSAPKGVSAAEMNLLLARAAVGAQKASLALQALDGVEHQLPELTDYILYLRAHAHRVDKNWPAALELYHLILKRHSSSPFADFIHFDAADAYFALGQHRTAEQTYEYAIQKNPRTDRAELARFIVADLAQRQGRFADASRALGRLAFQVPRGELGDQAFEVLAALVADGKAQAPTLHERLVWIDRLLSARSLEHAEQAIAQLRQEASQGLHPSKIIRDLDYRDAIIAFRRDNYPAAIDLFSRSAHGASSRARHDIERWLARVWAAADEFPKAIEVYTRVAKAYAGQSAGREALFFAGWLAFQGDLYSEAVSLFERYLQEYPTSRTKDEVQWYLAWCLYRSGQLPLALNALKTLRLRHSRSSLVARAHYWEGRILETMDQSENATAAYQAALQQDPVGYYGAMAKGRILEMADTAAQLARVSSIPAVAALHGFAPQETLVSIAPVAKPKPTPALSSLSQIPWNDALFDWHSPLGQRTIRLMRLGLHEAAAREVSQLAVLGAHSKQSVLYSRARLLYELGEYNKAYRLAAINFEPQLKSPPKGSSRGLFHMTFPDAHASLIMAAADEYNVSPLLLFAIIRQESGFNHRARSWASAVGLMQIIPTTANRIAQALEWEEFEAGLMKDPAVNIRFGAWYLSQLVQKFRGNIALAIGGYNAGPNAVAKWVERKAGLPLDVFLEEIPFRETRHYVKKVLSNLAVYAALYTSSALELPHEVPQDYADNIDF